MAGAYESVHLALLTSCTPIHSGKGEIQRTLKGSTHLDTHLNRAIAFTDGVCFMFESHNHCGRSNLHISFFFSAFCHESLHLPSSSLMTTVALSGVRITPASEVVMDSTTLKCSGTSGTVSLRTGIVTHCFLLLGPNVRSTVLLV